MYVCITSMCFAYIYCTKLNIILDIVVTIFVISNIIETNIITNITFITVFKIIPPYKKKLICPPNCLFFFSHVQRVSLNLNKVQANPLHPQGAKISDQNLESTTPQTTIKKKKKRVKKTLYGLLTNKNL